ncbi:MAG TPA: trypsin-like peptidase domain-containing protein [Vicinamibacterales bacterium]|nr:trypsin-like peptidase domain-containing protein [Vicinamibacterales bacterium]
MKRASIGIALLIAGFIAGLVLTGRLRSADESTAQTTSRGGQALAVPAAISTLVGLPDLTTIAAQAVRGVVNISSVQVVSRPNSPFADDPFFQYFFGGREDIFGSRDQLARSLGSGVLISDDGYVVTNSHVIGSERAEITVVFGDKHQAPARIIGIDKATDLALVKVAKPSQPPLKWGDSSKLKVAEWVLAIGSPYQLSESVSVGIVSALGRKNLGFSEYEDFIQTDAAINRGNSGGALVNARGDLIGINTGILSESGGYQGIGFAIPSNLARRIIGELVEHGIVRRGSLGRMNLYPLTTQLAEQLRLRSTTGVYVDQIDRRSPAFQAGVEPGDVIVSFNGQDIVDPAQLIRLSSDAPIGSTAVVIVMRDRRRITLKIPVLQREG